MNEEMKLNEFIRENLVTIEIKTYFNLRADA